MNTVNRYLNVRTYLSEPLRTHCLMNLIIRTVTFDEFDMSLSVGANQIDYVRLVRLYGYNPERVYLCPLIEHG